MIHSALLCQIGEHHLRLTLFINKRGSVIRDVLRGILTERKRMGESVRNIIKKHNIRLTRSLGQNFLTDGPVIKRIADAAMIESCDLVIEVGPGIGNMTRELALKAGHVMAIEIDRHLIPALSENLADLPNVEIIHEDVMRLNIRELAFERLKTRAGGQNLTRIKVVSNLPYYITTPVVMKFLEEMPEADTLVFMVQKEVADRMAAEPGGKDYGALTVAVRYYANPERMFTVPPHCFIPQPDVESAVIRLRVNKTPPVELLDRELFFKTVKAAFGQRRKTLVNALYNSGYFMIGKEEIKKILEDTGVDENCRGEELSIMQFASLANSFSEKAR